MFFFFFFGLYKIESYFSLSYMYVWNSSLEIWITALTSNLTRTLWCVELFLNVFKIQLNVYTIKRSEKHIKYQLNSHLQYNIK